MTPVIDMQNYITLYNCKIKINNSYNVWDYYFKPVSKYKLEDVYKSKNVIICDNRTSKKGFSLTNFKSNFKYFNGFQFLDQTKYKIFRRYHFYLLKNYFFRSLITVISSIFGEMGYLAERSTLNIKGIDAKTAIIIQDDIVNTNACLTFMTIFSLLNE